MSHTLSRRRYNDDFKRKAVQTLLESGKPVTSVAADIGVEQSNLHKWKKKFAAELSARPTDSATGSSDSAEISALRKDLESVRQTVNHLRNIVIKTLGTRYSS
jgi:transposase